MAAKVCGALLAPRRRGKKRPVIWRVCLGLIATATKGAGMAAHSAYVIWYMRGRGDDGVLFLMSDGIGVGYGARPFADGNDAVYLVAQENYPAEFLEAIYPVRLRRYAINPDSGGPGLWRGGCGIIREFELLASASTRRVTISTDSAIGGRRLRRRRVAA